MICSGKRKRTSPTQSYGGYSPWSEKAISTKTVSFQLNEDGKDRPEVIPCRFYWDELQASSIWYSKQDIKANFQEIERRIEEMHVEHDTYIQSLARLFEHCSLVACKKVPRDEVLIETTLLDPPLDDIRGLERKLHSAMLRYRYFHANRVLSVQAECREQDCLNPTLQERALRKVSSQLSRPSRFMAQLLAYADSKQVVSMIYNELAK